MFFPQDNKRFSQDKEFDKGWMDEFGVSVGPTLITKKLKNHNPQQKSYRAYFTHKNSDFQYSGNMNIQDRH